MMGCGEFQERLGAGTVESSDSHAASCQSCAALLAAFEEVDAALGAHYSGVTAPQLRLPHALPQKPSPLPAALDWLAWSGVTAACAAAIIFLAPGADFSGWGWALLLLSVAAAFVFWPTRTLHS